MKPIHTLKKAELIWKQPKILIDRLELCQDDNAYAEIFWTRLLSDTAIGRTAGHQWTFNRKGCLRDQVLAVEAVSKKIIAVFEFDWLKNGTLTLANGRSFEWYRTKTFATAYALVETGNKTYLKIEHGHHWFKQRAWITSHFPSDDPDLPLLLCLTMYLVYCINQDNASAIAATTSVAAFG